jgi:hypothetical protein
VQISSYLVIMLLTTAALTNAQIAPVRNPNHKQTSLARAGPKTCPPAGIAPMQRSAPNTGDHRVILTWKANTSSSKSLARPIGYCLYRSKIQGAAQKKATCAQCEQVNKTPLPGTACVDDLAQSGVTYYYVAVAIGRTSNQLSISSNEALAVIPSSKQNTSPPNNSAPFCRDPAKPQ